MVGCPVSVKVVQLMSAIGIHFQLCHFLIQIISSVHH